MKRGHRIISTVENRPAVYRIEFGVPGAISAWYVGETQNFKGRVGEYGVMIRRLLALYSPAGPVIIDKDLFRLVQYEFARSMVNGGYVHWRWRYVEGANTKKEEDAEIAVAKKLFPCARSLNQKHSDLDWGYFEDMPAHAVDPSWRNAHERVTPHKNRKNLRSRPMAV